MKNDKLFTLLSCYYALESKLRCYHWNVHGENFVQLHELFEKQYDVLADEIDAIAEQIRKLGELVPGNMENYLKAADKADFDTTNRAEKSQDMLQCLIEANKQLAEMIVDIKAKFDGDRKYISTCAMMDSLLESREKDIWFLESCLK